MIENIYKIEKPKDFPSKDLGGLASSDAVKTAVMKAQASYIPWHEFKNKAWVPGNKEEVWSLVKIQRIFSASKTIIIDKDNKNFTFDPHIHSELLHYIDLELGGTFMGINDFSERDKHYFIRRNIIEESISSSQLEGANTSREVARKMLLEGRKPKNYSEKMIANNHNAMKWIEEDLYNKDLSIDTLKELHRKITFETIDDKHYGVFRETLDENGQPLVIKPWDQNVVTYIAPPKEFVEKEIIKFINFANDSDNNGFIHPLIKAIMLHFWIGFLHPFEDGNGRLARIIFYWYMLRKGYWAFSYISLSKHILNSARQYSMSYVLSEQDGNDLNYFIHYNIEKLKLARQEFKEYIERKMLENRKVSYAIQEGYNLNNRQFKLIQYLLKDEQRFTTLQDYQVINTDIRKNTAVSDLKKLVTESYLKKVRNGRNIFYYPTDKIKEVFR